MVLIGCISRSLGQNRFSKCNFQKSSRLKLQGPGLSYLMSNINTRSSTNICWTTLVVLCKWLDFELWHFPQVSDLGPFGPSCLYFITTIVVPTGIFTTWTVCTYRQLVHFGFRLFFFNHCSLDIVILTI